MNGIKVSQPGFEVRTTTPSHLAFSSEYQTLKVQQQGSGALTDSGGRIVTIPHNLGYVPQFLVHSQLDTFLSPSDYNYYYISPFRIAIGASNVDRDVITWADSTNLYIEARPEFGYSHFYTDLIGANYLIDLGGTSFNGYCDVGNNGTDDAKGGLRFVDVNLSNSETIYKAEIGFYMNNNNTADVPVTITGVDEDNTGDFGDLNFGRTRTSASVNATASGSFVAGDTWHFGVKSIVDEIISRGGWSANNSMAFYLERNGGTVGSYIATSVYDGFYNSSTYLRVLKNDTLLNYKYTIYKNKINP